MLNKALCLEFEHIQLLSSLISYDNAAVIGNAISASSNFSRQVATPNERENKYVFLFLFERPLCWVVIGNTDVMLFVSITHLFKEKQFQIVHCPGLLEVDECDSLVVEPLPKLLSCNCSLIKSIADQSSGELLQAFFLHAFEGCSKGGFFLLRDSVAFDDLGIDQVADRVGVEFDSDCAKNCGKAPIVFKKVDTCLSDASCNYLMLIFITPWGSKAGYQAMLQQVVKVSLCMLQIIVQSLNHAINIIDSYPTWIMFSEFEQPLLLKFSIYFHLPDPHSVLFLMMPKALESLHEQY